ncbi:hypothetical protein [Streptomyces sp. ISL-43]|nr:hypothetical protein [Streptomyces sp. ISL-43]
MITAGCYGSSREQNKPSDFFQNPAPEPTFTHIPVRGPGLA